MNRAPWRTALVTGASSGIGRAFATELAGRGTDVVVVARRQERLEELAAELASAHGRAIEVLAADLAEPSSLAEVEARLADPSRPVDLLVNCAGFGTQGLFAELPVEGEDEEIRVNVLALVRLTRAALPAMIERGHGGVVNVSSVAGEQPIPRWATYTASKAFVTTFSRAVNAELHGTGVHVLTLLPGFVRSEFQDVSGYGANFVPGPAWTTAEQVARTALADLERGRDSSIPGVHYRALAAASRLAPWALSRRFLRVATRKLS